MTWKEFKDAVESQEVEDDTYLRYIDWNGWGGIKVILDEDEAEIIDG